MEKRDNNSSRIKPNLDLEIYYSQNYNIIAGVDEAGRGPWVGPVYSAAVILDQDNIPDGINDSKKISPRKRKEIFNKMRYNAFNSITKDFSKKRIDQIVYKIIKNNFKRGK